MPLNPNQLDAQVAKADNAKLSDADLAALLSAPILTPKKTVVTSTTLGNDWSVAEATKLKAVLRAMIAGGGDNGALADYVLGVLEGAGFDPSNPQALATAEQFVAAKIVTQDQINAAFYDTTYLCGDVVAEADVTEARGRVARRADIAAVQQRTTAVFATWMNEKINPASADPSQPVPTWDEFLKIVNAG